MSYSQFKVRTEQPTQFVNITASCRECVAKSGVLEGVCVVYIPHTTAGVTVNEAADPAVVRDIKMMLNKLVPARGDYTHMEGNSDAHIKASLMGSSVHVPVNSGKLALGTWQGIFFCEFDGPRTRSVSVQVIGK
ncbi:MAG: YjbQ family protein [Spirochaetales bacterium]|nr:YjbQ family protein [Spirochaetales bacterium]